MLEHKENVTPPTDDGSSSSSSSGGSGDRGRGLASMSFELHHQRIVRFGENENDIFMLRPDDTARTMLVHKLKQDPTSPDRWLDLLKYPSSYEAKLFSKVRLFRRATTFIPKDKCRHMPSYVEIWVLFAKIKENEKEARDTFKYMKSERIGENEPMFYQHYATFEYQNGNHLEAEEILSMGVRNGIYSTRDKDHMYQQLTQGKDIVTPSTLSSTQRLLQTPCDQKTSSSTFNRSFSTPVADALKAAASAITTPSSISSASALTGFSTARKHPRAGDSSILTTPSMASRASAKAQTTTRKAPTASRFFNLGGPPLRVIASTTASDDSKAGLSSTDEDDDDMGMNESPPHTTNQLSPIREATLEGRPSLSTLMTTPAPSTTKAAASSSSKPTPDLSYIKNWAPRPLGATSAGRAPSFDHHHELYRSPKRQQLAPSGPSSPVSMSSVSSTSSPRSSAANGVDGVPRDPFASLTSKVVVNGRTYIKLEQIGSGGSSKVYRMLGPDLKIYALKKIKLKRLDPKSIEQYTNEIELLQRLQGNPFIIRLISAEQDLQQRIINVLMEHGEIDLGERLREMKDGLDENFLRVIWTQMLQAVHAIHRERIIHGDLKPANFLFVNGTLKLIDFGIAKAISNDTTNIERDSQVGTVNFMSPEAIQGNAGRNPDGKMKVGRASDIWSLGCILYQVVYGKPPFADVHSIIEKFRCIIDPSYPIPFPSLKNKDLEDVIRQCLQRDHRARPTIDGPGGLLTHPFLRNSTGSAGLSITSANAESALNQMADLLRAQGVANSKISTFLSIGREAVGSSTTESKESSGAFIYRPKGKVYKYDTEERRTEI
ncbi:hypothetical protein Poli38472_004652 [Pythium oligandrum]|uniref:Protein kinase domain-containing protein n=1 Tax=Pythium oligandrum TaxID=41045 RepID=A0A8K1CAU5_PYTOL|nr:hypothetical protein Poli38472_004652 [Pythium oligandrum]|eukprot:TMW59583.1 hypothetical protein Poli38472_004652 [Pythium oligandrum]